MLAEAVADRPVVLVQRVVFSVEAEDGSGPVSGELEPVRRPAHDESDAAQGFVEVGVREDVPQVQVQSHGPARHVELGVQRVLVGRLRDLA